MGYGTIPCNTCCTNITNTNLKLLIILKVSNLGNNSQTDKFSHNSLESVKESVGHFTVPLMKWSLKPYKRGNFKGQGCNKIYFIIQICEGGEGREYLLNKY